MKTSSRSQGGRLRFLRVVWWCAISAGLGASSSLAGVRPVTPHIGAASVVEIGGHEVSFTLRDGARRAVHIEAHCLIRVPQERVWRVLTDYEHLDVFVPFLTSSRVTDRIGGRMTLRQEGRVSLLMFHRPFTVTFQVHERPMQEIRFQAVAGDFRRFEGGWTLTAHPDGTIVEHHVEVEPAFFTPRWVMRILERRIMLNSIGAVIQRCEART